MTTLALYGGPLKRAIIQRAYGYCGQSTAEFELSPEEYTNALQLMNDSMALLGDATGYNFPASGDGSIEDESGIAGSDVLGATVYLAQLLAPSIGKALTINALQARAASNFLAKCTPIPQMEMGRGTIRGAGNRLWNRGWGPFFVVGISADEVPQ